MSTQINLDNFDALSIEDTAKKCRISKTTLYAWIKKGRGPTVRKIGRRSVILAEDRMAWLRALPVAA